MREKYVSLFSVCIFFEGSKFTFQFLNDTIHNYPPIFFGHNCEFYDSKIGK